MDEKKTNKKRIYGLPKTTIDAINSIFINYPQIEKAILYGSRARGNFRNGSDIDLTLIGYDLSFSVLSKIEWELDDLLLPYKIDLSNYATIKNEDLLENIDQIGKVFYEKEKIVR